jgi:hypothetical protein
MKDLQKVEDYNYEDIEILLENGGFEVFEMSIYAEFYW